MCYTRPDLGKPKPKTGTPGRRGAPCDRECQGTRARRSRADAMALPIPGPGSRSQKKAPGSQDPAGVIIQGARIQGDRFRRSWCVVRPFWGVRGRRRVARWCPPSGALCSLSAEGGRTLDQGSRPAGSPCPSSNWPLTKLITHCIIILPVAHGRNQYWSYHTRSLTRRWADNIAVHSRGLTGVGCFYIPGLYAHRSGGREASILVQGWQPMQTACPEGGSPR